MIGNKKGCFQCKDFWQFSEVERPNELMTNLERQSRLYKCNYCGSFWEEYDRCATIISKDMARCYYKNVFKLSD